LSEERRIVNWLTREITADGIREAMVAALLTVDPAETEVARLEAEQEELVPVLPDVITGERTHGRANSRASERKFGGNEDRSERLQL
jgi:hypothetical protein